MKRFFCTTCKRVVRTRRLPQLAKEASYIDDGGEMRLVESVSRRHGTCTWHDKGNITRHAFNSRLRETGQRMRKVGGKRAS